MPRAKVSFDHENMSLMIDIANLKSYSTDLLCDAGFIYQTLLGKYGMYADDDTSQKVCRMVELLSEIKAKPINENRVYLISGMDFFRLVMHNLDPCVVEHMRYVYDLCNGDWNLKPTDCPPPFLSSLFIFQKGKVPFWCELSSGQMSTLIAVFHKENLVNFSGARDDLYGKPRRLANRDK